MKQYYYTIDGTETMGPCSETLLSVCYNNRIIKADTQITLEGSGKWQAYSSLFPDEEAPKSGFIYSKYLRYAVIILVCAGGWIGYQEYKINRSIDALSQSHTSAEDIFPRDMDIQEFRTRYYDIIDGIRRADNLPTWDLRYKAYKKLDKFYNTARAELGLPPID